MSKNNRHTGQNMVDVLYDLPKIPFSYSYIVSLLSGYKKPRDKISSMIKKGEIIQIKRGLYILSPQYGGIVDKKVAANLIYGPSYISLDYALSYWRLTPEKVEEITCVTNKRNKRFQTEIGVFSYKYINDRKFSYGFELVDEGDQSFFIATREKALCDKIYFEKNLKKNEIAEYIENNLRIDIDSIKDFDDGKVKSIAENFNNSAVSNFYKWYRGMKR